MADRAANRASRAAHDFEVRDPRAEEALKRIGESIREAVPSGMGFALFLFDFGDKGNMFYISNSTRQDMAATLRDFLEKFAPN